MELCSKRVKRILFLVDTLNVGGTETQAAHTAIRLNSASYDVTVGCLRAEGPLLEVLQRAAVPVVEFRKENTLLSINGLRQLLRLSKFLRKEKFHVIHAYDLWANLLGVPAAWLARTPVVITSRRHLADLDWYSAWRNWVVRLLYHLSTHVVVNAASVRELLVTRDCIPREKIHVIYNGVDADRFAHVHREKLKHLPGIPGDSRVIAVLANLYRVKGHAHLIKAACTVCGVFPETVFLLIGDGPERANLEQRVRDVGLGENVLFLGSRHDIPELLGCCDLSVLPSESEGFPNSLIETLAAGLPAVATRVGGNFEIIRDGVDGLLVPPKDPQALAGAILHLLRDPEFATRLARAGQARVRKDFGFERLITELTELYNRSSRRGTLHDRWSNRRFAVNDRTATLLQDR